MLLIEQLKISEFSSAEQQIVEYLIKHPETLHNMTITDLARLTYTNTTSVMRVAKKMNYTGWVEFKKAYLEEWAYLNNYFTAVDNNLPFTETDSLMTIAQKIAVLEQNTLKDSLSLLNDEKLALSQEILTQSSSIYVYAEHSNAMLAEIFVSRLRRINYDATIVHFYHNGEIEAYNCAEDSCAIVISYTGENAVLVNCVEILKQKEIPIISITSMGNNTLAEQSDCSLFITTREKLYSKISSFTSSTSIMYLLNILYSIVFSKDYHKNLNQNIELGLAFEHRNTNVQVMKEDESST